MSLYDRLRNDPDLMKKGFEEAGITAAIEQELEPVDHFKDLYLELWPNS